MGNKINMPPSSKLPIVFLYTDQSSSIEGATRFQKLVFLAQEEKNLKGYYDFRPDRFGPYSVGLRADIEALENQGLIERDVKTNKYGHARIGYSLTPDGIQEAKNLLELGNESVFDIIQEVKREYNDRTISGLLKYVYRKYDEYVEATDLDTESLFDPDAVSEFEEPIKRDAANPSTLGDVLTPTPHTLYQLPKRDTNAYFYYFTDHSYSAQDSKFHSLDEQLTLFGRNRSQVEVAMIDRDRMRAELWDTVIEGFGIDDYPALVVANRELGVRDIELGTERFVPADGEYAVIESGLVADSILDDTDQIRDFLNGLFDCARNGNLERGMRKRRVVEGLKIGKEEITDILNLKV